MRILPYPFLFFHVFFEKNFKLNLIVEDCYVKKKITFFEMSKRYFEMNNGSFVKDEWLILNLKPRKRHVGPILS